MKNFRIIANDYDDQKIYDLTNPEEFVDEHTTPLRTFISPPLTFIDRLRFLFDKQLLITVELQLDTAFDTVLAKVITRTPKKSIFELTGFTRR